MGREWEACDENGVCDVCGAEGFVWDIYGDFICPKCMKEATDNESK